MSTLSLPFRPDNPDREQKMLWKSKLLWTLLSINTLAFGLESREYSQQDLNSEAIIAANWIQHAPEYRALLYQGRPLRGNF